GDVAMLAARLVGPSGDVVGVERDPRSIARARARVAEAGLRNVSFTQSDVNQIQSSKPFDAAVGRFILMWLPDPASVLRQLSLLVRPGGVVAFQEPSWAPVFAISTHLALWSAAASLMCETIRRSRANPEMGLTLYRIFQEAGLPAPAMQMELPLGDDPDFIRWMYDVMCSLRPQIQRLNLSLEKLGDFDTLLERLQAELGISASQLGILLAAFFWTYTAMQFVSGWLVDRFDVNWVIAAGYLLWSLATATTGFVRGFAILLTMRLMLGIGESVAFPCCSKILARDVPEYHRGFANGVIQSALRCGNV